MVILSWPDDWEVAERCFISAYRAAGVNLLNISAGGQDMRHVIEANGRFPAYMWAMKFLARTGDYELADKIREKWAELRRVHGREGLIGYNRYLRNLILEVSPLAKV